MRIRDKAIADFLNNHPVIITDFKKDDLREAKKHFIDADKKFNTKYYEDSIRDIGIALEILLKIMLYIKKGKEPEKDETLNDLINQLQYPLEDESIFGNNVIQDLRYITRLRNKAVHDSEDSLPIDRNTTYQAIQRAKIFFKLFQEYMKQM